MAPSRGDTISTTPTHRSSTFPIGPTHRSGLAEEVGTLRPRGCKMDVFVSWRDITYEPVRSAGAGGIGKVSVALATTGPNKGVLFAVKTFSPDSREKQDWKQAFMREVHVLRECNHPAIVKVFDEGV